MRYDYIKGKLYKLNYSNRDIEILISVKNQNLLKKYFFGQGIRIFNLMEILKNDIKKPLKLNNSKIENIQETENEDDIEQVELEVSVNHNWSGSLSVYGTSFSVHTVHISRTDYENMHRREIERYCEEEIDFSSIEPEEPSDYDTSDSVYWDSDFQSEIDNIDEI